MSYLDEYYDDSSGDGGGGSSLTSGILQAVTQLGSTAILANSGPNVNQNYPYRPPTSLNINPVTGQPYSSASSGVGMLFIFGLLAVVAFFFLKR